MTVTRAAAPPEVSELQARSGSGLRHARRILLACGILASVHYIAMNVVVPLQWDGYSLTSQTVSELSAIGAPTRPLWVVLASVFTALFIAFGLGVWLSARQSRPLRIAAALILAHGFIGVFWPPMHPRGSVPSLTDTLHIVWSAAAVLAMVLTIVFAAAALGRRFRLFSAATLAILLSTGVLTALDGPKIAANLPTPWIGVWERISIGAFFVWLAALAVILCRGSAYAAPPEPASLPAPSPAPERTWSG